MVTIEQIKDLRNLTGAGVNAVREALEQTNGDMEKSVIYLREKGLAKADKRKDKVASNGILGYYFHTNKRMMINVEVACETDFAANSEDMNKFVNDVALHIAATNPRYIHSSNIPAGELNTEKEIYLKELEGKPEEIKEKILQGKLEKYFKEIVLLNQTFFSDESKTVQDYLNEMVAKIGEKIIISRFSVFKLGEDLLLAVNDTNS